MSLAKSVGNTEEQGTVAQVAFLRNAPICIRQSKQQPQQQQKQRQQQHHQLLHQQQEDMKASPEPKQVVFPRTWESIAGNDSADGFTVVTYNILTDICMPPDEYLYCPTERRGMGARHPRIMAEVMTMQPDVLCLQEVDAENFSKRLLPDLKGLGYESVHYHRADNQGLVASFKTSVFEMMEHRPCVLHEVADKYIQAANASEATKEEIRECIARPVASLMLRLKHKSSTREVAISNIHVSWEQLKYPALQALQVSCATNELVDFAGGPDKPHIICGDFNTPPSYPAYRMLTDGLMRQSTVDHLKHIAQSSTKEEEPAVTNCDDCGMASRTELCLDYIWFSSRTLDVTGVLRTPPSEAIFRYYALPSILFPSDHIPLKARFAFH